MEEYFQKYRKNIIGVDQPIQTFIHKKVNILYADWVASGRLYSIIEDKLRKEIFPFVANTHTDTNHTGMTMTYAYHKAQEIIKAHVGANDNDILISSNSGMTGVINKFQRILGLKIHESFKDQIQIDEINRPIVFVTHMEHHSNHTSWYETIAEVVIVPPNENGLVDVIKFRDLVQKFSHRKTKIAAITSCSNVTGIITPYMEIAKIMHEEKGLCFVDFACSAPYIDINMHELDEEGKYLDAIYFSPHKFLGGPGSSGIVIFSKKLYNNTVPDNPGGGTVDWTNPWGKYKFIDDIESREDGGTPAFLQTIKTAMCCQLKSEMGVENIRIRENEILQILWEALDKIPNLHILAENQRERLGVISFYIDNLHYSLGVKMLNDRFGIQTRGGCSCAGTYGHYLLNVTPETSKEITDLINEGDCSTKPGWMRLSIHPTHTNKEILYICHALKELSENFNDWKDDYIRDLKTGNIQAKKMDIIGKMEQNINNCLMENFV